MTNFIFKEYVSKNNIKGRLIELVNELYKNFDM